MIKRRRSILIIIIVFLLIVCAVVGILGVLTNGFSSNVKTFGVTIADETYTYDTHGLTIENGSVVTITSPFDDNYEVAIYANATSKNEFDYYVDQELYHWSSMEGIDLTSTFITNITGNSFTISYIGISEIISSILPVYDIFITSIPKDISDLFVLMASSGDTTITIGFTLTDFHPQGFELSTDNVIF